MEAPFMVLRLLLPFSYGTACKENVSLCFNAREVHVLCWVDKAFKSEKICSISGFIACEGNCSESPLPGNHICSQTKLQDE